MDIISRTHELEQLFSPEQTTVLEYSQLEIRPFRFHSAMQSVEVNGMEDDVISENKMFNYYVFTPKGREKQDQVIFLLHGLNERSWKKYLPWAEYLAQTTGKAVLLFPIAFHINRSPQAWMNPRQVRPLVDLRNRAFPGLQNATFVNAVLSDRLSQKPSRFFTSGMETVADLLQLAGKIKNGEHPLFKAGASIQLFGYSIGAMISEILLLSNPNSLFSDSRLFMFCGGSVFSKMNANARDILDSATNEHLQLYYSTSFWKNKLSFKIPVLERCKKAFQSLISAERLCEYRETLLQPVKDHIQAISLKADNVIPTAGIQLALGKYSGSILKEMDFPYPYSHQWPFPLNGKAQPAVVNACFRDVFDRIAGFLLP
ncbi:MAG: DUF6051 family protein [Candidatus Symbiothrix sp.]|jgi:predicted esterase|nr:DUF6051 family protein [Candidatus Symbiothrix sp.]